MPLVNLEEIYTLWFNSQDKAICPNEEDLQHKLNDLVSWLINRDYKAGTDRLIKPELINLGGELH